MNLRAGQAFILAIIPLNQIRIDLGDRTKTRQFASLRARCSGLAKTFTNVSPLRRSPRCIAFCSPCSVRGRSVSPVC